MRVVLGVSRPENHINAMEMIAALHFPKTEIHAVHVIDRLIGPEYFGLPPGSGDVAARLDAMQQDAAESALRDAAAHLENLGVRTIRREVLGGFPGAAVCHYADEVHADLIALGWEHHGPIGGLFAGSVARSVVVNAHQSILLAKKQQEDRPLRCLLATDHSPYMDRCVEKLLKWRPTGIGEIKILTAFPERTAVTISHLMPEMSVNVRPWIEDQLQEKNKKLAARISEQLSVQTESVVTNEPASKAIRQVMSESKSDLLILGAQGHGFFGRAALGSVSYPLAVYDEHSVLVIREL